ncbi:hypothetical protein ACVBEJ_07275 [Porticoccus sp. GXU_MW_L64]
MEVLDFIELALATPAAAHPCAALLNATYKVAGLIESPSSFEQVEGTP